MSLRPTSGDAFGLALGVFATLSQVVLMREALALAGGNELVVGLGFATWLAGVGGGALAVARLRRPLRLRLLATLIAPVVSGGALALLRLHRELLQAPPGVDPSLFWLVALLAVAVGGGGATIGALFTAAARSFEDGRAAPVSRLYAVEALGALVGGLGFSFALAGVLSHLSVVGIAGALLTASLAASGKGLGERLAGGGCALLIGAAVIAGASGGLDRTLARRAFQALGTGGELVASGESPYGRLSLARSEGEHTLLRDGRIDHSFPDPWGRSSPVHLALAQHPRPERVLIVGGGPSDRISAALAHHPERVVFTFVDAAAYELTRPHWDASTRSAVADERVLVVRDDGRRFVAETEERFDVVLIAAPPPRSAQANRYHTLEFFGAVRRILRPGGAMTVLAPGGANLLAPEAARATASELATLLRVFARVVIVPGLEISLHAASQGGVISADPSVLRARFEGRRVSSSSFSAGRFEDLLEPERVAALGSQLAARPAEINTDSCPRVYLAALQLWERGLGGGRDAADATWTGLAERSAWAWLAVPLALALAWMVIARRRRRGVEASALLAIASTGAAGMAAEIVVLYVFQAASGRLYTGLALLVALFMAGLAGGALLGRRFLGGGALRDGVIAEASMLAVLLASGLVLPFSFASPGLAATWSLVAGLVTGLAFPAFLGRAAGVRGEDERRAAAGIEAADHFGAAFGALVTGVIWLPVFGVTATFALFAVIKVASLAAIVVLGRGASEHR